MKKHLKAVDSSFLLYEDTYKKLKAISKFEGEEFLEVLNNTIEEGIKEYEKRNGDDYFKDYINNQEEE